ncbi:hypothetical protein GQ43DRAFT_436293, partial [Delitschia confertaspora ATCC 74209]
MRIWAQNRAQQAVVRNQGNMAFQSAQGQQDALQSANRITRTEHGVSAPNSDTDHPMLEGNPEPEQDANVTTIMESDAYHAQVQGDDLVRLQGTPDLEQNENVADSMASIVPGTEVQDKDQMLLEDAFEIKANRDADIKEEEGEPGPDFTGPKIEAGKSIEAIYEQYANHTSGCTNMAYHEKLADNLYRIVRRVELTNVKALIGCMVITDNFLDPFVQYRDNYLLNPRFRSESLLKGGFPSVSDVLPHVARELKGRTMKTYPLNEHTKGFTYTIRLFSNTLLGLCKPGRFFYDPEWEILKSNHVFESLTSDVYAIVKHIRFEYIHGHGPLMDAIEKARPCQYLVKQQGGIKTEIKEKQDFKDDDMDYAASEAESQHSLYFCDYDDIAFADDGFLGEDQPLWIYKDKGVRKPGNPGKARKSGRLATTTNVSDMERRRMFIQQRQAQGMGKTVKLATTATVSDAERCQVFIQDQPACVGNRLAFQKWSRIRPVNRTVNRMRTKAAKQAPQTNTPTHPNTMKDKHLTRMFADIGSDPVTYKPLEKPTNNGEDAGDTHKSPSRRRTRTLNMDMTFRALPTSSSHNVSSSRNVEDILSRFNTTPPKCPAEVPAQAVTTFRGLDTAFLSSTDTPAPRGRVPSFCDTGVIEAFNDGFTGHAVPSIEPRAPRHQRGAPMPQLSPNQTPRAFRAAMPSTSFLSNPVKLPAPHSSTRASSGPLLKKMRAVSVSKDDAYMADNDSSPGAKSSLKKKSSTQEHDGNKADYEYDATLILTMFRDDGIKTIEACFADPDALNRDDANIEQELQREKDKAKHKKRMDEHRQRNRVEVCLHGSEGLDEDEPNGQQEQEKSQEQEQEKSQEQEQEKSQEQEQEK